MRLYITDKSDDGRLDCVFIPIDNFNDLAYHPYIHTTKWDTVVVDLDGRITRSYIKQVINEKVSVVPRLVNNEVGPKQLFLLCEIYPDDSAEIMGWAKLNEADRLSKVEELSVKWKWSIEY